MREKMMDDLLIPAQKTRAEIVVVNSHFIATVSPAFSVEQAREFIHTIRQEFPDASHHVPAFLIGHGNSVMAHCSDDGEPSGTAGRPILAVLSGSGLGDVALVVTRYFGGTKLGTGGLVRAYTDAAKAVLNILPLAKKVPTHLVMVVVAYPLYERAKSLIDHSGAQLVDQDFGADVTLTFRILTESFTGLRDSLVELSNGKTVPEIIETNPETIMPVKP